MLACRAFLKLDVSRAAAEKLGRVVQQGSQMRSSRVTLKAEQLLKDGIIGDVKVARAWTAETRAVVQPVPDSDPPTGVNYDRWLGPAPTRRAQPRHRDDVAGDRLLNFLAVHALEFQDVAGAFALLVAGGADAPEGVPAGGYYVKPTVFGKVKPGSTIEQEEIFGPVLSIVTYKDEEDAIRIANDTPYGLAGAVWSKDEARAQKVARRIRAGQVDVNGGAFNMNAPFGGFKQSGHGREAGVYGLEEFLEYKSLQLKG